MFVNDNRAFQTSVCSDLTNRFLQSLQQRSVTPVLSSPSAVVDQSLQHAADCVDQSSTAACYDAFFNSSLGSGQSVLNAQFLFFHFDFGSSANLDNSNAAGQLCQVVPAVFHVSNSEVVVSICARICAILCS